MLYITNIDYHGTPMLVTPGNCPACQCDKTTLHVQRRNIHLLLSSFMGFFRLHFVCCGGYTNVLKIDLKCPEKYIKAYIFFLLFNGLSSNLNMLNTLAYI
jgi:hypothetical protein